MAMTLLTESGRHAGGIGVAFSSDPDGHQVVVSAVGTRAERLLLISWRISSDGRVIDRLADSGNQAGEVQLVETITKWGLRACKLAAQG